MADVADVLGISEHVARRHYAKRSPNRQERIAGIMQAVFAVRKTEQGQTSTAGM